MIIKEGGLQALLQKAVKRKEGHYVTWLSRKHIPVLDLLPWPPHASVSSYADAACDMHSMAVCATDAMLLIKVSRSCAALTCAVACLRRVRRPTADAAPSAGRLGRWTDGCATGADALAAGPIGA